MLASGDVGGQPVTYILTGKPLVDWFTKSEYDKHLVEV
jgi:hypothetical protein